MDLATLNPRFWGRRGVTVVCGCAGVSDTPRSELSGRPVGYLPYPSLFVGWPRGPLAEGFLKPYNHLLGICSAIRGEAVVLRSAVGGRQINCVEFGPGSEVANSDVVGGAGSRLDAGSIVIRPHAGDTRIFPEAVSWAQG